MFLLLPASAVGRTAVGMAAMTASPNGSRFSFLALLMALFLLGYVVWLGDRLTVHAPALALARPARPGPDPAPGRRYLAPRCAVLCKIAMGITMGYMLILML